MKTIITAASKTTKIIDATKEEMIEVEIMTVDVVTSDVMMAAAAEEAAVAVTGMIEAEMIVT